MPKPQYHIFVCTNTRPPDHPKGSCGEKGADTAHQRRNPHGVEHVAVTEGFEQESDHSALSLEPSLETVFLTLFDLR